MPDDLENRDIELGTFLVSGYIFGNAAHITGLPAHGDADDCTRGTVGTSVLPCEIGTDVSVFIGAKAQIRGIVAERIVGDGARVTCIDAGACTGEIDADRLPRGIRIDGLGTRGLEAEAAHGAWTGDAAGVTSLDASRATGTVPAASIPDSVDVGAARGAGVDVDGDIFGGALHGDASRIRHIPASEIQGRIDTANLPDRFLAEDVYANVHATVSGTCIGSGSGVALSASAFERGTFAAARLPPSLAVDTCSSAAVSGSARAARIHGNGAGISNVLGEHTVGVFASTPPEIAVDLGLGSIAARRIAAQSVIARAVDVDGDVDGDGCTIPGYSWSRTIADIAPGTYTLGIAEKDMRITRVCGIGEFVLNAGTTTRSLRAAPRGEILETDIPVQAGQRVTVTTSGAAHVTVVNSQSRAQASNPSQK